MKRGKQGEDATVKRLLRHIVKHGRGTMIKAYLRGVEHGIKPVVLVMVRENSDKGVLISANCRDVSEVLPEDADDVSQVSRENFPVLVFSGSFSAVIGISRPN